MVSGLQGAPILKEDLRSDPQEVPRWVFSALDHLLDLLEKDWTQALASARERAQQQQVCYSASNLLFVLRDPKITQCS